MERVNLLKNKLKPIAVAFACITFSLGIFAFPNTELLAQEMNAENPEQICGEDGVEKVIHGERKGIFGCWGSDTTCKTKCK